MDNGDFETSKTAQFMDKSGLKTSTMVEIMNDWSDVSL